MSLNVKYSPSEVKKILEKENNVYFIGIGGISMSSLAYICNERGFRVGGSDRTLSALTKMLSDRGIPVFEGHDAAHTEGFTVFVYNAAIHPDNPEFTEAQRRGNYLIYRADFLGYIVSGYENSVGVAGTHGKSTTTAMLGLAMLDAGLDPTVLDGAVVPAFNSAYRHGGDKYLCFEACEYKDSFLSFFPKIALVLNAELDHVDYFGSFDNYLRSFRQYLSQSPYAVVNTDSDGAGRACEGYSGRLITCGYKKPGAFITAGNIAEDRGHPSFDIYTGDTLYAKVSLGVFGTHNISNALCCAGVCYLLGISGDALASALSSFGGVKRRFEYKLSYNGARIYDDYAHHPTEIKATLAAAREVTAGKLYIVFQPHTYSRTHDLYPQFLTAFADCDEVIFADIYAARETDTLGMSAQKLAKDVENGKYVGDTAHIAAYLKSVLKPGDAAVITGAGNIDSVFNLL